MATKSNTTATEPDGVPQNDIRFSFEILRNIDTDGKVDLTKIAEAMGYTNVNSVGNRFRELRKRYGFMTLECKAGSSPVKEKTGPKVDGSPTKRGAGRPKKGAVRKGAKVSSATPIPAMDPVSKAEESAAAGAEAGDVDAGEVKEEEEE
ncbi:hypothetical protein BDW59DRAFT_164110 [Aspergillus cavernicola]|uniref:Uncharacterized protein n=1 Tax=Aspergillus cavernicola TaxID=176166 RepID=A0ABR4I456_9EURO